ncbi:MAG: hypothetical protein J5842_09315 [Lachnospiraceae bacterium]|nr:hypothetical protein [Lachnospiraceae bacterium]
MTDERLARQEMVDKYRPDVEKLSRYVGYLTEKAGGGVSSEYRPEGGRTVNFPVYDSTLLSFVKEAGSTVFMDKNYPYVYSRNGIRDYRDELALIEKTDIMHMANIGGILSSYVLGGRTKGRLWAQGVENGVYLAAITKARSIIDFYTRDKMQ